MALGALILLGFWPETPAGGAIWESKYLNLFRDIRPAAIQLFPCRPPSVTVFSAGPPWPFLDHGHLCSLVRAPRHDLIEVTMAAAQIRMKALVASRLMMGDLPNWAAFEKERNTAGMIANRRTARSVSSQIGRSYRELSTETKNFITGTFSTATTITLPDCVMR